MGDPSEEEEDDKDILPPSPQSVRKRQREKETERETETEKETERERKRKRVCVCDATEHNATALEERGHTTIVSPASGQQQLLPETTSWCKRIQGDSRLGGGLCCSRET